MACLATVPRVGLGGQILATVSRRSGQLGLERVTVHPSPGAVSAYERAGFELSPYPLCRPIPRQSSN